MEGKPCGKQSQDASAKWPHAADEIATAVRVAGACPRMQGATGSVLAGAATALIVGGGAGVPRRTARKADARSERKVSSANSATALIVGGAGSVIR